MSSIGKATFTSYERDLYWSIFLDGATCRWSGYDDGYWWKNVATSDRFLVREHQGKHYRLNPQSNEVTLVLSP